MTNQTTLKENVTQKSGRESQMSSTERICSNCGKSHKKVPQVFNLYGKVRDHSYYEPDCDCIEKIKEIEQKKKAGQKLAKKIRDLQDCGVDRRHIDKNFSNYDGSFSPVAYKRCKS